MFRYLAELVSKRDMVMAAFDWARTFVVALRILLRILLLILLHYSVGVKAQHGDGGV